VEFPFNNEIFNFAITVSAPAKTNNTKPLIASAVHSPEPDVYNFCKMFLMFIFSNSFFSFW